MAANDPGLAPMSAPAEDATKGNQYETKDGIVDGNRPVAPDQFDEAYETSRMEIW